LNIDRPKKLQNQVKTEKRKVKFNTLLEKLLKCKVKLILYWKSLKKKVQEEKF